MKKLNFKQKFFMSLGVLAISIITFTVMTFFVFRAPFQMDTLFNEVVLSLVVSIYAFFIIQYGSWVGMLCFVLGFIAAFWALAFSVERSGGNAVAFNGLFIWIIVMASFNVIGLILDLVWKSKRKTKKAEKLKQENEKLEQERIEAERIQTAASEQQSTSIHLNDITVDEPLNEKENNVD
ncbi:hypothetical protein [Erysipelothrix tonsillarum]|uniref:hypothetical protein n=1 Tax=Erysipelothrix tonsillarum TaxID=38402 RepID=UPI00036AFBAE|nr:hypothetical protein [Erysipelothrix tonsillarum]